MVDSRVIGGSAARDLLLERVVDHFVADGLGDLSLRKIAAAIGTSHRMLLYHFGSKNGLLLEVVRTVEARSRSQLAEIGQGAGLGTDDLIRKMWRFVADPVQADFERLFFALYGRALQGDEEVRPLLAESIRAGSKRTTPSPPDRGIPLGPARATPASVWRWCEACCSTCWPRETGPVSMPRWRSSPAAMRARGGRPSPHLTIRSIRSIRSIRTIRPAEPPRTRPSHHAPRNAPGGRRRPQSPHSSPDRSVASHPLWPWRGTRTRRPPSR